MGTGPTNCRHTVYDAMVCWQVTTLLCRMPACVVRLPSVRLAIQVASALFRKDFPEFLRLQQARAPPMVKQLMAAQVDRARCEVMLALAASFRMLPPSVAVQMLRLPPAEARGDDSCEQGTRGEEELLLIAVLKAAADRGSKGALQALSCVQSDAFDSGAGGGSSLPTLVFKQ